MKTILAFLLLADAFVVYAETSVWTGGTGTWNTPAHWNTATVPNSLSADVLIDGNAGSAAQVTLDINPSVGSLTVDADDALTIPNSRALTVYSTGGLTNDGTISLWGNGTYTYLTFNGSQTLSGTGEIVLGDSTYNVLSLSSTDNVLKQAAGHTIRGAGRLLNNSGDMINCGTVRAIGSAALTIDPRIFFTNEGLLSAEGSGGLMLAAGTHTNSGHIVQALDGSKVTVLNGAIVVGGTLSSGGTGQIVPNNGARLDGVTLAAGTALMHANAAGVTASGGLTNHGCWSMNGLGLNTTIAFSGNQTLAGLGEIVLSDNTYNRIVMAVAAQTLTHDAGHTIRGAGDLLDNIGNLTNAGTIVAQGSHALVIDPSAYFVNAGTLRAEGSGGLTFAAGTFTNAGQVIEIRTGSKVTIQSSAVVVGGTLLSEGTGQVVPLNGARLDGLTLAAGTAVTHANGAAVTVSGGLTNRGRWNMNGSGTSTALGFSGDQTLGGEGELVLSDNLYNRVVMGSTAQTLTHAAGHTIRGAGNLLDDVGNLINAGSIRAQGDSRALIINPSTFFVNVGTLRAEGAAGLTLAAGTYTNAGQVITAGTGSKVTIQYNAVVVGGTLLSEGTGQVVPGSSARLDGVTIAPGTVVSHANGTAVTVTGGLTNRGRWGMNGIGTSTTLIFSGDQTLEGEGELVLLDSAYNRIMMASSDQTLTQAAGHTIRGAGLLLNNVGNLDNYGRILAVGTKKLAINTTTSFRNLSSGVLGGTGTLNLYDGLTDNAGIIAPGLSVGTLMIDGNLANAAGAVLDIELGGAASGQYDKLVVQGAFALDGELRVSLTNSFIPEPEDTFPILSATSLSGTFANAIPAEGNIATHVMTDFGSCDVIYDYTSSPKTVTISNVRPDPKLLRCVDIETAPVAGTVTFAPSATDWLYTLQFRPSLTEGDWQNVPGQGPRPGIGRRDLMTDTNAPAASGFYRVIGAPASP